MKPIYLQDRTSIEVDWTCEMMYYWYKLHNGIGLVPVNEPAYFRVGRELHDDLSQFAEGRSTAEVLMSLPSFAECEGDQLKLEPLCRRIGWIVAFGTYLWPLLIKDYEVVQVETELVFDRTPLWIPVKPDLILRSRKTGELIYIEYKTTGSTRPNFALHWPYAIQVHLGIAAVEEELGEKVAYGQIIGLYKGIEQKGKLRHPYVWAYTNPDTNQWTHEWKSGWDLRSIWDYPGGAVDWAHTLGKPDDLDTSLGVMRDQFVFSHPVFKDDRMLKNLVQQRIKRGAELEELKRLIATDPTFVPEHHFDQRTIHCKPVMGSECSYKEACFNWSVNQDPIGSGLYAKRIPHHDIEIVGVEALSEDD